MYIHTTPNNKKYIGITHNPVSVRWGSMGNKYRMCKFFYKAIEKYGWDNIKHDIILTGLSDLEAKQTEKELIAKYKTNNPNYGYNRTEGGDGVRGYRPTPETRAKLSNALLGNKRRVGIKHTDEEKELLRISMIGNKHLLGHKHSEETRQKMSDAHKGRKVSDETRKKLSISSMGNKSNLGRKYTEEIKAKISASKLGVPFSEQHRKNVRKANMDRAKTVECLTLNGDPFARYDSIGIAIGKTGISKSSIWRACRGKQASAGGYIWRYV